MIQKQIVPLDRCQDTFSYLSSNPSILNSTKTLSPKHAMNQKKTLRLDGEGEEGTIVYTEGAKVLAQWDRSVLDQGKW